MLRDLYPELEPYHSGILAVDDRHQLYFELSGNPQGRPIVVLHGGPGGGSHPSYRQYFDPQRWQIILFDQRGCGRSTPHADLMNNTTWHLVADIEALRSHLGIDRWTVFGGSWGSTLALTYAISHGDRCLGLILRGIFLLRRAELLWFYQEGASWLWPEAWQDYLAPIPIDERDDLIAAYYRRLTSEDPAIRQQAAIAWSQWEARTSKLLPNPELVASFGDPDFAAAFARIECHYFLNRGFFESDGWLLAQAHRLRAIPGVIVQGRYDVVCPARSAWDLHQVWPEAELLMIPDAGHSMTEPGIRSALVAATDRFAALP